MNLTVNRTQNFIPFKAQFSDDEETKKALRAAVSEQPHGGINKSMVSSTASDILQSMEFLRLVGRVEDKVGVSVKTDPKDKNFDIVTLTNLRTGEQFEDRRSIYRYSQNNNSMRPQTIAETIRGIIFFKDMFHIGSEQIVQGKRDMAFSSTIIQLSSFSEGRKIIDLEHENTRLISEKQKIEDEINTNRTQIRELENKLPKIERNYVLNMIG